MDLTYSGGGNPRAEISNCIRTIHAAGGGTLTIVGEHVVDGSIEEHVTDLTVDFSDTGQLILGEGLSVPVFNSWPDIAYTGTLRFISPRIDCSRGRYIGGKLSSSAICASLYNRLEIYDCDLTGGGNGDSGISPLGIVSGLIEGGCIDGFADLGIYVTGGLQPTTHDEYMLIEGVKIKNCRQGIDSKRSYKRVTAKDCKIINAEVAYRMSWVGIRGSGPVIPPGLRMDVVDGLVKNPGIAFQPEGPGVLSIDGTKVVGGRKLLGKNQGAMLAGRCRVDGNTTIKDENLTVNGTTYRPTTKLKVM